MLLGLQNVTFEFGARTIVEDATWHIQPNERIGLVGYNGTGKSTLLKVLTRQYSPAEGSVEQGKGVTIGFLHQDLLGFDTEDSILEVAMGAFERVKQVEKELEIVGAELEKTGDEKLANDYADLLHEMDVLDGYSIHHKTEEILQGLGFTNEELGKKYKLFSGGWRMRVLLSKMILQNPDVLLLDEPTNHLDLPSIEWLEKYLLHYPGAVVIVSHDRFFLDRMVNKVVELYQEKLHIYSGNYSYYEQEKEIRIDMQKKAFENQQDYIRQNERFVERFKAKASKAAAAQSIVKRLEKLDRIEDVELQRPNMKINFAVEKQPGRTIVTLKDIEKSFGDINILDGTSAEIERGDKIALIGANGKGKSTLLRIIADREKFDGERIWGHNVQESFYAQHQLEALNGNNDVLEELKEARSGKTDLELRSLLGAFLFSGEAVDKKIKVLSGGEKARVALAKTIASKANFLMLDEPTNHLDIHSVDLLAESLIKYEGSIVLVSHDRYFVSKLANKIWEIDDHQIVEFKGTYAEWEAWKQRKIERLAEERRLEKAAAVAAPKVVAKPVEKKPTKQEVDKKEQFRKQELLVEKITAKKAALELELAAPDIYIDATKFANTESAYKLVVKELADANVVYEKLFEEMMG